MSMSFLQQGIIKQVRDGLAKHFPKYFPIRQVSQGMPAEVQVVLDRLTFKDVPPGAAARDFTNRYVYGSNAEGVWTAWVVGYSTPEAAPDDIILELGYNSEDGMVTVNIAKHGWNLVQVFFDGVLKATLPDYRSSPYDTLLSGVVMLMLQEHR